MDEITEKTMTSETDMLQDERDIARLVAGFAYRDQQRWEELSNLFWPDAHLSISWFSGPIADFVFQSSKLSANSKILLKHLIGTPRIDRNGERAVGDTDICIMLRAPIGDKTSDIDVTTWARFIDRFEKREGVWKISRRIAIYEKDRADPVVPGEGIAWKTPARIYSQFPYAYRNLATMLSDMGREEMRSAISADSAEERDLISEEQKWLRKG